MGVGVSKGCAPRRKAPRDSKLGVTWERTGNTTRNVPGSSSASRPLVLSSSSRSRVSLFTLVACVRFVRASSHATENVRLLGNLFLRKPRALLSFFLLLLLLVLLLHAFPFAFFTRSCAFEHRDRAKFVAESRGRAHSARAHRAHPARTLTLAKNPPSFSPSFSSASSSLGRTRAFRDRERLGIGIVLKSCEIVRNRAHSVRGAFADPRARSKTGVRLPGRGAGPR